MFLAILHFNEKYLLPGTTIRTDCWKAYAQLGRYGYIHETVNHSLHFRYPETRVHTNTIEGTWLGVKLGIPLWCRNREVIDDYLWGFVWKRINMRRLLKR
uniref:DDE_Tnp_IS1595 domain-containing protein n=1 Tax=Strongyloides papillosus TaxID=174720 RepID=A0A0N5BBT9_STREA